MKTLIAITEDDEGYEDISLDLRGCNLIDIVGSIGEIIHQVADMYEMPVEKIWPFIQRASKIGFAERWKKEGPAWERGRQS